MQPVRHTPSISLRPIDSANEAACAALRVSKAQEHLIASNAQSLLWAKKNDQCVPLGIYDGAVMVGFAMYESRGNRLFSLHQFMIDVHYQQRGFGRQAMKLLVEQIQQLGGKTIYLSFRLKTRQQNAFIKDSILDSMRLSQTARLFTAWN